MKVANFHTYMAMLFLNSLYKRGPSSVKFIFATRLEDAATGLTIVAPRVGPARKADWTAMFLESILR